VYFVDTTAGATPDLIALGRILEADTEHAPALTGASSRFVTPRLGTRSPWSSKATEILQGAGLPVRRVERGLRYDLLGVPAAGDALWPQINALLSDPMMQTVWNDLEQASALFQSPARGVMMRVTAPVSAVVRPGQPSRIRPSTLTSGDAPSLASTK
jgi:phosphoribosylformylglycinamidine synthase